MLDVQFKSKGSVLFFPSFSLFPSPLHSPVALRRQGVADVGLKSMLLLEVEQEEVPFEV